MATKLICANLLDQQLCLEALLNHGFKCTSRTYRRFRFFGKRLFEVEITFIPGVMFLEKLLEQALAIEDYWCADGIQRLINIRKGTI
jgi:hypothetical protein